MIWFFIRGSILYRLASKLHYIKVDHGPIYNHPKGLVVMSYSHIHVTVAHNLLFMLRLRS